MIKIQIKSVRLRELDRLEGLLDKLLGKKNKEGIATGPNLEEVSSRIHAGRSFSYSSRNGEAKLRARLEDNGKYYVELDLNLKEQSYNLLIQQCQSQAPTIYAKLPKNEDRKIAYQ